MSMSKDNNSSQDFHIHNVITTFVFSMRVIGCSSVVIECVSDAIIIVWKHKQAFGYI